MLHTGAYVILMIHHIVIRLRHRAYVSYVAYVIIWLHLKNHSVSTL